MLFRRSSPRTPRKVVCSNAHALVGVALLFGSRTAGAQSPPSAPQPVPPSASAPPARVEHRTHAIGPRYDYGTSHAVGAGYLYLVGFPPSEPFFWGVGADARVVIGEGKGAEAISTSGVVRVTAGHAPPMTLELSLGPLFSASRVGGVGSAGLFLCLLYADFGYSYQVPLVPFERPSWLSSHQFSLRIHIPVVSR